MCGYDGPENRRTQPDALNSVKHNSNNSNISEPFVSIFASLWLSAEHKN